MTKMATEEEESISEDGGGASYQCTMEIDSPESSSSSSTDDDGGINNLPASLLSSDENDADIEEEDGEAAAKTVLPGKKILRRKKKAKRNSLSNSATNAEETSSKGVRFASVIATSSDGALSTKETHEASGNGKTKSRSHEDTSSQCAFTVTEDDSEKSEEELRQTLFDLRQQMNVMKVDLSAEKALRRSKEKNLVKLAKQLGAKAEELEETERLMNEMQQEIIDMEESNKKLMDQVHSLTAKRTEEVASLFTKLDELRGVGPGESALVCNGSLFPTTSTIQRLLIKFKQIRCCASQFYSCIMSYAKKKRSFQERAFFLSSILVGSYTCLFFLFLILACVRIVMHPYILSIHNGLCAPALPGTTLTPAVGSNLTFESPWWAPYPLKGITYRMLCAKKGSAFGSQRPVVHWDGVDTLTVSLLQTNGMSEDTVEKPVIIENIFMTTLGNSEISVWKKQKGLGSHQWLWPSNRKESYTGPWCQSVI